LLSIHRWNLALELLSKLSHIFYSFYWGKIENTRSIQSLSLLGAATIVKVELIALWLRKKCFLHGYNHASLKFFQLLHSNSFKLPILFVLQLALKFSYLWILLKFAVHNLSIWLIYMVCIAKQLLIRIACPHYLVYKLMYC
jgi:hypothetical protein